MFSIISDISITPILKSRNFTLFWKYSVCGLKFEISEYPLKFLYVTYSPYQYELKRIKTHEMRAKNFRLNLFSVHCNFQIFEILFQSSSDVLVFVHMNWCYCFNPKALIYLSRWRQFSNFGRRYVRFSSLLIFIDHNSQFLKAN